MMSGKDLAFKKRLYGEQWDFAIEKSRALER